MIKISYIVKGKGISKEEKSITVGIKTFFRKKPLKQCLDSLKGHDFYEVIIADDGEIDVEKENIYKEASKSLPLNLIKLDFNTGLAEGRNKIVKSCKSEYLLILDDDHTIPSNVIELKEVLENDNLIGGVSCIWNEFGRLKCTASDLYIGNEGTLVKKVVNDSKVFFTPWSNIRYKLFDFVPNSTLFKIECLKDYYWDPFYKIGKEHLDFYLTHKIKEKWKFAVALNVIVGHFPLNDTIYLNFRRGEQLKASDTYFKNKFNIKAIKNESSFIGNFKDEIKYYSLVRRYFKLLVVLFQYFIIEKIAKKLSLI
jgi:glycosyltransferase involved in cell wall biosynthesis